jgi:hypothetical protein
MPIQQDHLIEHLIKARPHYAFRDSYRADDLVTNWRNYTAREDRFNRYAEMTSHGPSHLEGVAGLVAEFALTLAKGAGLNSSEMFVLKAMAHLHDIGMYTTYDPHFKDPFRIRDIHGHLSQEAILREAALLFPGVDDGNAVRLIGLLCAYHQGKAALSDREMAEMPPQKRMRIPAEHRLHGIEEIRKDCENYGPYFFQWSLERELKFAHGRGEDLFRLSHVAEDICPFLLAALIKLLDGCDFQSARIGSIEAVFRHADRNQSHLERTRNILSQSVEGSDSSWRARKEAEFFSVGIFHLLRNLMIEKTMFLATGGALQFVIKPAAAADVRERANALVESMGGVAGAESGAHKRMRDFRDLVDRYEREPAETVINALQLPIDHYLVREWDVSAVPPDPCDNIHYLVARKYIHREYDAVRHAMAGPKGKSWPYCADCPNREGCSLKERPWPCMETPDGLCNVASYDARKHAASLAGNPRLGCKPDLPAINDSFPRVQEECLILERLKERKRLILAGPDGRGRSTLMARVARQMRGGAGTGVFHFSFAGEIDQIPGFIRSFAAFLASRGDFLLSNVIVGEEPSSKHEGALLEILKGGRPEHRGQDLLMCLDDLNRLKKGEDFFRAAIEAFPCISCRDAAACRLPAGERFGCEKSTSYVLITSTKRPGDRWLRSGGLPVYVHETPSLMPEEIRQLTTRRGIDPQFANDASAIWQAYGGEAFVIPIWRKYAVCGWNHDETLRSFEGEIVAWLVNAFGGRKLGGMNAVNAMRLVAMLHGCVTETEIRTALGISAAPGEDELTMLFGRGLIQVDEGCLAARSSAWSEGHRRSHWLDLLEGNVAPALEAYIGVSERTAQVAVGHWADLQPYLPGRTPPLPKG